MPCMTHSQMFRQWACAHRFHPPHSVDERAYPFAGIIFELDDIKVRLTNDRPDFETAYVTALRKRSDEWMSCSSAQEIQRGDDVCGRVLLTPVRGLLRVRGLWWVSSRMYAGGTDSECDDSGAKKRC
jgi:hypothetical protein